MNSQTQNNYPWGGTWYGYDPSGKRVMKETNPDPQNLEGLYNPSWEFYFYTINGQKLVTRDCNNPNAKYEPNCWVVGENVYFKNKLLVSNGVFVVTDRLGSVRANLQGEAFAYYPYCEERTNRPDGRDKFATYFRDSVGQDYADQRYYNSSAGRFWSVDPGGIATAKPGNPGSWNRYAYVQGDPVNFMDPQGLFMCAPSACPPTSSVPSPPSQYNGNNGSDGPTFGSGVINDPADVPPSAYPKCNPGNSPGIEADLSWIAGNYGAALAEANVVESFLQGISPSLSISANAIAIGLLEWSANESGYGQNVLNIAENNFFGIQNAGNGATTMGGLSIVPCQRNGQPIPVNSKNACVAPGTTWGQELVGSLNMSNKGSTYLSAFENALISGYGVAGALQAIGDNGWNGSSTYGATLTTNMKLFDFMNNNGYLQ